jgi:SSS family solute:Na+ symporter
MVFIIASVLLMAIGTMLYCYYSVFPMMLPSDIPHDYIYPFFTINQMPVGIGGLFVASLLASCMASFSSYLMGGASTVLNDLDPDLAHSHDEKRRKDAITKGCIILSASSTIMALFFTVAAQWMNLSWTFTYLLFGTITGTFVLAVFLRNIKQKTVVIAVGCGLLAGLGCFLWIMQDGSSNSLTMYLSTAIGFTMTLLTGFLLNKVAGSPSPAPRDE